MKDRRRRIELTEARSSASGHTGYGTSQFSNRYCELWQARVRILPAPQHLFRRLPLIFHRLLCTEPNRIFDCVNSLTSSSPSLFLSSLSNSASIKLMNSCLET